MKNKQKLLRYLDWERKSLEKKLHMIEVFPLNLISEAFPQGRWENYYEGPEFTLPLSFPLVEEVKYFMSLQFPEQKIHREYQILWDQHKSAAYFLKYSWDDICNLEFRFDSTLQGATCQILKIGEEVIRKPIYEVTCPEAEPWPL